THINNWFMQGIGHSVAKQFDLKADHSVNNRLRLTARYSQNRNHNDPPNLYGLADPAIAAADPYNGPSFTRTQSATGNFTFVQNATTLWTFTYGLIYSDYGRDPFNASFDETTLGLPKYIQDTPTRHVFPMFSAAAYSAMAP